MGAAASAVANLLDHSKEEEAKAKEQLELMTKLADARLDTFEGELKSMFLDHESAMKTSVPGKRGHFDSSAMFRLIRRQLYLNLSTRYDDKLTIHSSRVRALAKPWTLSSAPAKRAQKVSSKGSKTLSRLVFPPYSETPRRGRATIRSSLSVSSSKPTL